MSSMHTTMQYKVHTSCTRSSDDFLHVWDNLKFFRKNLQFWHYTNHLSYFKLVLSLKIWSNVSLCNCMWMWTQHTCTTTVTCRTSMQWMFSGYATLPISHGQCFGSFKHNTTRFHSETLNFWIEGPVRKYTHHFWVTDTVMNATIWWSRVLGLVVFGLVVKVVSMCDGISTQFVLCGLHNLSF